MRHPRTLGPVRPPGPAMTSSAGVCSSSTTATTPWSSSAR